MGKTAISVTLDSDNLLWLKGQTAARKARSVSETLDAVVAEARTAGCGAASPRSVVGTIDIATDDPDLARADAGLRDLFDASISRPVLVRETPPAYRAGKAGRARRG